MNDSTVFGYKRGEGIDAGSGEPEWIVAKDRYKYDQLFDSLNPIDGKITGSGKKLYLYNLIDPYPQVLIIGNDFMGNSM